MATVQIILHINRVLKENKHTVVLRLTIDRIRKYYSIGENKAYICTPDQWDFEANRFNKNYPDYKTANKILDKKQQEANTLINKAEFDNISVTFHYFETTFFNTLKKHTVLSFFNEEISRLESAGSLNYANTYQYTCKSSAKSSPIIS